MKLSLRKTLGPYKGCLGTGAVHRIRIVMRRISEPLLPRLCTMLALGMMRNNAAISTLLMPSSITAQFQ
jgi:hypothetical protein